MSTFEESTNCCGIMELVGMNEESWSPKSMLKEALEEYWFDNANEAAKIFCQVIFSVAYNPKNKTNRRTRTGFIDASYPASYRNRAKKFAKFIEDNKLGSCVLSKGHMNHGNFVLAGLWTVSRTGLAKWIKKEKINVGDRRRGYWEADF